MKYCKFCNANIEGLTHHCDCCGAPIKLHTNLFIWQIHTTAAGGDLPTYVAEVFRRLNQITPAHHIDPIPLFVFEFFCYPKGYLPDSKIINTYYSSSKKQIHVKVVMDYNEFIYASKHEKGIYVEKNILQGFLAAKKRIEQIKVDIKGLATAVEELLSNK